MIGGARVLLPASALSQSEIARRGWPSQRVNREHASMDPETDESIDEDCNNAVFEVCDARERYPKQCAEELGIYLAARNSIAMEPVVLKPSSQSFEIPALPDTRERGSPREEVDGPRIWENKAEKLQSMVDKVQELKVALKLLEDNRNFEIKHLLK